MLVRMSKKQREYILRSERPGYFEEEIAKANEELAKITDPDEIEERKKAIDEFRKEGEKKKVLLEKYGPAKWYIKSASKEQLAAVMSRQKAVMGTTKGGDKDSITAGMMGVTKLMSIQQFKSGFLRVDNLVDMDSPEDPATKKRLTITVHANDVDDLIDALPDYVIFEIAAEISGSITEDEAANLS